MDIEGGKKKLEERRERDSGRDRARTEIWGRTREKGKWSLLIVGVKKKEGR